MGAKVRFLFKLLFLNYFAGIVLVLIAPSFNLMLAGFILAVVPYLLSIQYWGNLSEGVTGKESLGWYLPIIGSILILHSVGKSYNREVYKKPKNFDTFFKKAEEIEISI